MHSRLKEAFKSSLDREFTTNIENPLKSIFYSLKIIKPELQVINENSEELARNLHNPPDLRRLQLLYHFWYCLQGFKICGNGVRCRGAPALVCNSTYAVLMSAVCIERSSPQTFGRKQLAGC